MGVTVLLSIMHLESYREILERLHITGDAIIINQGNFEGRFETEEGDRHILFLSNTDRGLSKSRNLAIREAIKGFRKQSSVDRGLPAPQGSLSFEPDGNDSCIFCDNDICYVDNYEKIIEDAFNRHPESDILVFFIERPERKEPVFKEERELSYLYSMKIFSPEIAFRLRSIRKARLFMDEDFGAGAKYGMGEENIFLFDAKRKGLKVTYIPIKIGTVIPTESTWFKGYTEEFFRNRGAGYYRMAGPVYFPLSVQFALRKRRLFDGEVGIIGAVSNMVKGKREYLSYRKKRKSRGKEFKGVHTLSKQSFPCSESAGKNRAIRLFIIGDYKSGTGPANVTKALLKNLPEDTLYLESDGKLSRAIEIFKKLKKTDAAVFSGYSRQNLLGLFLCRIRHIPSIYLMHGCTEYENRINGVHDPEMAHNERKILKKADLILAVSPQFEAFLKKHYPMHKRKTAHLTNGVEWESFSDIESKDGAPLKDGRIPFSILSVGGGMPRKRIIRISEAIDILRKKGYNELFLTVVGDRGLDTEKIKSYPFVRYLGLVKREKLLSIYRTHRLFIQDSSFETFGLAPLEALLCGDDILISDRCGVLSIMGGLKDSDLIRNPEDTHEIAGKIEGLLKKGNRDRLIGKLNRETTSYAARAEELLDIARKLLMRMA